ncbi:MAG: cyclase [Gammaproteobacteria bacterium]|nr:cyclase [Gammaproteobacteria bacterium]|tara:strand:- start:827 stop:1801 length:975 start_codon:yes stop_codon:yes gene_type:complete
MKRKIFVILLCATTFPVFQVFAADHVMADNEIDQLVQDLSNWGRWGADDQLGTLNLITEEKRREAAAIVRHGVSVSMAQDLLIEPAADNGNPFEHQMPTLPSEINPWAVDKIGVRFHGLVHSHIDALCHYHYKGKYYNDRPVSMVTEDGCSDNSVMTMVDGIFTRGILMDIPRLKGQEWLEPGYAVTPEDLEAWEAESGITVGSGDAVLLRTGRWARREAMGPWAREGFAGWHVSAVRWLKERDVAIIGSDAALDVSPSGVEGIGSPVHMLVLVALGMPILDAMNLEAASSKAEELGKFEFLLTAAPLRVPQGTGSPLNAIATF